MHGIQRTEDGSIIKFEDPTQIALPPSFKEYEKGEILWLRPEDYMREIAYDNEMSKRRAEKKQQMKRRKTIRKQSILSIGGGANTIEDSLNQLKKLQELNDPAGVAMAKEEIQFEMQCIWYDQRHETEEEVKKRKEEAEKLAAADKNAKKKPPPKGQVPVADPMDEP